MISELKTLKKKKSGYCFLKYFFLLANNDIQSFICFKKIAM